MRLTLPVFSLLLVFLTGTALARPGGYQGKSARNETLANLLAKRQTSRNQINMRKHVKDTVKRVHQVMTVERDEALAARTGQPLEKKPARMAAPLTDSEIDAIMESVESDLEVREPAVTVQGQESTEVEKREETPSRTLRAAKRQVTGGGGGGGGGRRALPAPARALFDESEPATKVQRAAKRQVTGGGGGGGGGRRALPARAQAEREYHDFEERSYPKCSRSGARTGYAHYPGWKLVGDELSGALPVKTAAGCQQTCNKYGGACSGMFFDSVKSRCYLKGVRTSAWKFTDSKEDDSVDLIGGCALWANIVPQEMDEICCRD